MKKGLLSLLAVVLTVVGCQNYDDQFAALTKDIAAINTTLAGLATVSADVSALKTTVSGIQSSSTALETALAAAAIDIDAIEESVKGVASATDLNIVKDALAAVQADVKEILAANSVINQDVTINSVATLEYAESLISTKTDAPTVIVNGNVVVTTGAAVFSADQLVRVNAVTAKMATVLKDLTVSNTASPATTTVDFGALTFVDQSVVLTGATSTPKLKTITASLTVDAEGAIDYSGITNIGGNFALDGTGVTSLNLAGVTIGGSISTTGSATAGTIFLPSATSVDVGTAEVTVLSATVATDIDLGKAAALASLSITAPKAATVDIAATSITGDLTTSLATPTIVNMKSATSVAGVVSIDGVAQFWGDVLTGTGTSSIAANIVNLPALSQNASGTTILSGTHTAGLSLPALVVSNELTAAAAKIVTVKSATASDLTLGAVEDLTITALGAATAFTIDASLATLKTLSITGAAATTINDGNQTNGVALVAAGAALTSVTTAGTLQGLTITTMTANFKTVTTSGLMRDLTITGATELNSLTIGHDHIEGMTASKLAIINNDKLTAVTTTNLTEVRDIEISGNAILASIDVSSMKTLPSGSTSGLVSITNNALTGTYVNAVAATETTPYVQTIIKSNDLLTIKPLLDLAAASSTNTYVFELEIDTVTVGTATATLQAAIIADTASTAVATDTIDTAGELALIVAE